MERVVGDYFSQIQWQHTPAGPSGKGKLGSPASGQVSGPCTPHPEGWTALEGGRERERERERERKHLVKLLR